MICMRFRDRREAGKRLAEELKDVAGEAVVVAGLPRGGVPVAFEVAERLRAPLDVLLVRKLGLPSEPELAAGAIGEGGIRILDQHVGSLHRPGAALELVEERERRELERQGRLFRAGHDPLPLAGRIVIVVDDGIATGSTARAACGVARARGAGSIVLAAPVAPRSALTELAGVADRVVVSETPADFFAIGDFYEDFGQTTDEEVIALLEEARRRGPGRP